MELQNTGETSEQTGYAEVTASQAVLSATGEMSKNVVLNIPGGTTKKSKSDKKQSNDTEQEQHFKAIEPPVNKLIVIDDEFIGVERKRNKTKQLFLTGIAENVKEYQIQSYLQDRDVTLLGLLYSKVNVKGQSLRKLTYLLLPFH